MKLLLSIFAVFISTSVFSAVSVTNQDQNKVSVSIITNSDFMCRHELDTFKEQLDEKDKVIISSSLYCKEVLKGDASLYQAEVIFIR